MEGFRAVALANRRRRAGERIIGSSAAPGGLLAYVLIGDPAVERHDYWGDQIVCARDASDWAVVMSTSWGDDDRLVWPDAGGFGGTLAVLCAPAPPGAVRAAVTVLGERAEVAVGDAGYAFAAWWLEGDEAHATGAPVLRLLGFEGADALA